MVEAPGSVFEDPELGFDQRPIFPRFTFVLALEEFERLIVPGATASPHQRATVTPLKSVFHKQQCIETRSAGRDLDTKHFERLTIDFRPDVVLGAVDPGLRLRRPPRGEPDSPARTGTLIDETTV